MQPIHFVGKTKQEAHGPRLAHLSEIATPDMYLLCNIFFNSVIATNERIIIQADLGFEEESVFYTFFFYKLLFFGLGAS